MLRDADVWRRFENIVLVYSARAARDLGYLDELAAMSRRDGGARLHIVKTLTRDPEVPDVLHGRITALLTAGELERMAGLPLTLDRSRILLCGNPEMVEAMRGLLKARGFAMNRRLKPGHIIVENYW